MNIRIYALAAAVLVVSGCAGSDDSSVGPAAAASAEERRQDLLAADYAFAAAARAEGLEAAYERFMAADAVQLPDGGLPLAGKDAIVRNVAEVIGDSEFVLTWEPEDAGVSRSGDLGFTWGYYYLEIVEADGGQIEAQGKYANVWRRAAEGNWEVVLDMSNQNEALYESELGLDFLLEEQPPGSAAEDL